MRQPGGSLAQNSAGREPAGHGLGRAPKAMVVEDVAEGLVSQWTAASPDATCASRPCPPSVLMTAWVPARLPVPPNLQLQH